MLLVTREEYTADALRAFLDRNYGELLLECSQYSVKTMRMMKKSGKSNETLCTYEIVIKLL